MSNLVTGGDVPWLSGPGADAEAGTSYHEGGGHFRVAVGARIVRPEARQAWVASDLDACFRRLVIAGAYDPMSARLATKLGDVPPLEADDEHRHVTLPGPIRHGYHPRHMRRLWISWLGLAVCLVACASDRRAAPGDTAAEIQCEVKVTLLPGDIADAMRELGLVDAAASRFTVWYFDSRKLELFEKGVILRERTSAGERDKSTVKLRPMGASVAVPKWLEVNGFKREADRTGTTEVLSWGLSAKTEKGAIDAVAAGTRPVDVLFNSKQRKLLADCSPVSIDWKSLVPLGPIDAQTWTFRSPGLDRELTAERWTLPDGTEMLEISTRAPAHEAESAQLQLVKHLESLRISISAHQETKTETALEYLSER